jgi:hypothetical protein
MLLASGCSQNADSLFAILDNPTYTTAAVAGLQGIKLVVNILRDGFAGLSSSNRRCGNAGGTAREFTTPAAPRRRRPGSQRR